MTGGPAGISEAAPADADRDQGNGPQVYQYSAAIIGPLLDLRQLLAEYKAATASRRRSERGEATGTAKKNIF